MNRHTKRSLGALGLLAVLALAAGCSSDSVAPHEDLPPLSQEDAANQAGAIAMAYVELATLAIDNPGTPLAKTAQAYPVDGAGFSGKVWLDFLTAEGGTDATWDTAGWVHVYGDAEDPITFVTPLGGTTVFQLDFSADITRDPDTGVINGTGSMMSGEYSLSYGIVDLTVQEGAPYPLDGLMGVQTQGHSVMIQFDGTEMALLTVDETEYWDVNLATGEVTPVADPG